jgi:Flp pilus assembly protein TadG
VFVAVFALALLALTGLVVDGGRALAARAMAMDEATEAARAGAGQLSVAELRMGRISIDPAAATVAAERYLARIGQRGTATVAGQTVSVHVETQAPTVILGMFGIDQIGVSVTARATNVHGVARGD